MFSERIREALEHEVVGQSTAVNSVARGVTRLASRLTPCERSWGAYLLLGPAGTGRSHLVRSLARILYADERVFTIHAKGAGHLDPWVDFLTRLAPAFRTPSTGPDPSRPPGMPGATPAPTGRDGAFGQRLQLILVEDLERAHKELLPQLTYLLECGQEVLPDGRRLCLDGCLLFFTSGLCTDEILDQSRIGFSGTTRESGDAEDETLQRICREEVERALGRELVSRFDDLLVFQALDSERRAEVLDRYFARLSHWLGVRSIGCTLTQAARAHLLRLADVDRSAGVRTLVRIHRDQVEFPIADLLISGVLEPGTSVELDHRDGEEHLHFSVQRATPEGDGASVPFAREVPVHA